MYIGLQNLIYRTLAGLCTTCVSRLCRILVDRCLIQRMSYLYNLYRPMVQNHCRRWSTAPAIYWKVLASWTIHLKKWASLLGQCVCSGQLVSFCQIVHQVCYTCSLWKVSAGWIMHLSKWASLLRQYIYSGWLTFFFYIMKSAVSIFFLRGVLASWTLYLSQYLSFPCPVCMTWPACLPQPYGALGLLSYSV